MDINEIIARNAQKVGEELGKGSPPATTPKAEEKLPAPPSPSAFTLPEAPTPEEHEVVAVAKQEEDDIRALLEIDDENLDEEWSQQPVIYMRAVRASARASAAVLLNKLALRIRQASLARQFRQNGIPGVTGKVTEEGIKQAFSLDKLCQQLEYHQILLLEREFTLSGLVRAFEQRERSLKYKTGRALVNPEQSSEDRKATTRAAKDVVARAKKKK
jgi:hypothetical protein